MRAFVRGDLDGWAHAAAIRRCPASSSPRCAIAGAFALEQGVVFTAMILSAATVAVIERQFSGAAIWCGIAALLTATGLMHGYQYAYGDAVLSLHPAWPYVWGYAAMALVFGSARWLTHPHP